MGLLRILHVSDAHCATSNMRQVLSREEYDVAVGSGDFECVDTAEVFAAEAGEAVAVTGNLDGWRVREVLERAGVLIDGRSTVVYDHVFGGVGGLDPHSDAERLPSEAKRVDVLVSHHPPYGVLDESLWGGHAGLRVLLELHSRLKPRLHLFGHIHEARGFRAVNGVMAVNAGPLAQGYYAVAIVEDGRVSVRLRRL